LKQMDLPMNKIRVFATNVANYQPLGVQCPWCPDKGFRNGFCLNNKHQDHPCCDDPCKLSGQYNFGNNEFNYAAGLVAAANEAFSMDAHVVIDTGRSGVADMRSTCSNWCNPRGAGAGVPSTEKTANRSLVDAYFWLKTPGESDGCSETLPDGTKCPRFDAKCASVDSLGSKAGEPAAPEAGMWYDYQVKQLAENARFKPEKLVATTISSHKSECPAGMVPQAPNPWVTPSQSSIPGQSSASMPLQGGQSTIGSSCASAYQQCGGGSSFTGPKCCQVGCNCTSYGGDYHQCVPPSGQYMCSSVAPAASSGSLPQTLRTDAGSGDAADMSFDRRGEGSRTGLHERRPGQSVPWWVWLTISVQCGTLVSAGVCAWKYGCHEDCHMMIQRGRSPPDASMSSARYLRRSNSMESRANHGQV